jgi:hypothetical protein
MRVHYRFFMSNPRFWYQRDLIAADQIICVATSELRRSSAGTHTTSIFQNSAVRGDQDRPDSHIAAPSPPHAELP